METLKQRWHGYYATHREEHYALILAWRKRNPERAREINRAADRRYKAKVLRKERCITCGTRFPWTQDRENKLRNRGTRVVCSRQCGKVAAQRERHDDRSDARPARRPQARSRKSSEDQQRVRPRR
jgi:hypothetical protein